tara:strand:- start:77 stop:775 length:699 start_codon:yes stop_codon:yes gene_type:complete
MSKTGYIYKIFCKTDDELVYYGSTTQRVCDRISNHRKNYKGWKKGTYHFVSSYLVVETDDWDYMTIEKVVYDEPFELKNRERFWIVNNECVNRIIPNTTPEESGKRWRDNNKEKVKKTRKEYCENNKEKVKKTKQRWYEKTKEQNKEKVKKTSKAYYDNNKEKIKEREKQYRENNKEKIKELEKQYREQNKEKIAAKSKEKLTCECGCIVSRSFLTAHKKSKKHLKRVQSQS